MKLNAIARGFQIIGVLAVLMLGFQNCAGPNQIDPMDQASAESSSAPPLFSTYGGTRFSTSTASTWIATGESITIVVPAGATQKYRIFMRQMFNATAAGQVLTTLSSSPTAVTGTPEGLGIPYMTVSGSGTWSSISTEGYVSLPAGVHTFYVFANSAVAGTITYANASSDVGNYCIVMAWPL